MCPTCTQLAINKLERGDRGEGKGMNGEDKCNGQRKERKERGEKKWKIERGMKVEGREG